MPDGQQSLDWFRDFLDWLAKQRRGERFPGTEFPGLIPGPISPRIPVPATPGEIQVGLREQFPSANIIPDEGLTEEQRGELGRLGWTTQVGTLGGVTWVPPQAPEEPGIEFPPQGVLGGEVITLNGQQFLKTTLPDGSFDYRPLGPVPTEPEVERVGETAEQRQVRSAQFQQFLAEMELSFAGDPSKFIQLHFLRQIPQFLQYQRRVETWRRKVARQKERGEERIAEAEEALIPTQAVTTTQISPAVSRRGELIAPKVEVRTIPGDVVRPGAPEVGGVAVATQQAEREAKELAKRGPRKPKLLPPPLPAGLAQFIPGAVPGMGITAGLAQEQIPVPSPQQFMAASPTTRAQLRGFLEFGGQSYADILAEMERRLLPAPPGGRGRPTVARQR